MGVTSADVKAVTSAHLFSEFKFVVIGVQSDNFKRALGMCSGYAAQTKRTTSSIENAELSGS